VETRLRQETLHLGYWETMREGLGQVELFFNEPSDTGINSAMDQLWDSLQDLSHSADSESVRRVVVQRAEVLVEAIKNTRNQLQGLRADLNNSVDIVINEVNVLASQIADLNNQIGKVTATGNHPNDLLDQRDVLLEQLSRLVDIEVTDDHANMVIVTVDGVGLVQRSTAYALDTRRVPASGYDKYEVYWRSTGSNVTIRSGELGATLQLRDEDLQNYIDDLDKWTLEFVNEFNAIHRGGYGLAGDDGINFFTFSSSTIDDDTYSPGDIGFAGLDIQVNRKIAANPNLIAASDEPMSSVPGTPSPIANGNNAQALAGLRNKALGSDHTSLPDRFISIISKLGVDAEEANKMSENRDVLVTHLTNLREATSGVSLDEEMANMIKFQHAYNAAARLMTAVDETLDVIINRLGIVGR